ncbi:M23 family metallopeptidase [Catellatospora sp. KI3]|uniref:M23 family metallopeptidase n=1 Tax=Catellatospora sp. KI3 TaxID=3041620 RepID=UPI0024828F1A|nr:M23 family metallopeptidase [Catellatospora sp. KI3]MDI1461002.1 M23 family metallopeptidase [Catellatospora sp. KI3]
MTNRVISVIVATVMGVTICCVGGLVGLSGTATACVPQTTATPTASTDTAGRYDTEQRGHVATIVQVGANKKVPGRGMVIAVATAIQESVLRNLGDLGAANDHDSLGLFQQRPSQGWGTPQQVMDPRYAAGEFYDKLLTIDGWQQMPLTQAAQAVQRSAYPNAYAKWEPDATALVADTAAVLGVEIPGGFGMCTSASGWVKPVDAPLNSGFRTDSRPGHDGVDLGAGRGTPIRAAASGIVIKVRCNAYNADGSPRSCDIDGNLSTPGCGWYAEILHPDKTVTRYCHMLQRPAVSVGEEVVAGQIIGLVGNSGHSSGPHLHLETHTGQPATEANAVDPVAFFAARGVDLRSVRTL